MIVFLNILALLGAAIIICGTVNAAHKISYPTVLAALVGFVGQVFQVGVALFLLSLVRW